MRVQLAAFFLLSHNADDLQARSELWGRCEASVAIRLSSNNRCGALGRLGKVWRS